MLNTQLLNTLPTLDAMGSGSFPVGVFYSLVLSTDNDPFAVDPAQGALLN